MIRTTALLSFMLTQTLYSSDELTLRPTIEYLERLVHNDILDIRWKPGLLCPHKCCVHTFVHLAEKHYNQTGKSLSLYCRFLNHHDLSTFVENMQFANNREHTIDVYDVDDNNQTYIGTFTRLNS